MFTIIWSHREIGAKDLFKFSVKATNWKTNLQIFRRKKRQELSNRYLPILICIFSLSVLYVYPVVFRANSQEKVNICAQCTCSTYLAQKQRLVSFLPFKVLFSKHPVECRLSPLSLPLYFTSAQYLNKIKKCIVFLLLIIHFSYITYLISTYL